MPKREPAQLHLAYDVPAGQSYIDLARDLSRVNRRLYKQGMTYKIQNIQLLGAAVGTKTTDVTSIGFYTISNSYMAHNAWKKAKETWEQMQNDFADGQGSRLKGKWSDFKIYLDDSHAGGTTLDVVAGDGAAYAGGEWIYSNFVYDDAGTARSPSIHMIGTSTDDSAIGLIQAYGDSRNYPGTDPSNLSAMQSGFYAQFHGVGDTDDELGQDLRDDNDLPPYDADGYPGGDTNADAPALMGMAVVTAIRPLSSVRGFDVPCGLLKLNLFESQLDGSSQYELTTGPNHQLLITLAPGDYRGVSAVPMGQ